MEAIVRELLMMQQLESLMLKHGLPRDGEHSRSGPARSCLPAQRACGMQGHDPDAASFLMKPEDPQLSLMRLISQNAIATPRQVRRTSPPRSDATCFHTLLAGSGHLQVGTSQRGQPLEAPRLHACNPRGTSTAEECSRGDASVL